MIENIYRAHGKLCANHPWEVILATLSLGVCISSIGTNFHNTSSLKDLQEQDDPSSSVAMTVIKFFTLLYSYYQFRKFRQIGSKYLLIVASLFTLFSCCIFSSSVINLLQRDYSDLQDAIFFFVLLADLSRTTLLAQYAFSSSNVEDVKMNIAQGISIVGPTLTLDTLVETLLISIGTLSGIKRLEIICYYACLSVLVHYVIFMTVYPACLSLVVELSQPNNIMEVFQLNKLLQQVYDEESLKPNPILQRVKVLMSAGLAIVHLCSYWDINDEKLLVPTPSPSLVFQFHRFYSSLSSSQLVLCILLLLVSVKLTLFEHLEPKVEIQPVVIQEEAKLNVEEPATFEEMSDAHILNLIQSGQISLHQLEKIMHDLERIITIRREYLSQQTGTKLTSLPYLEYDYSKVLNVCCENVIGYIPVPVGVVGPLLIDGKLVTVPMATTEGCLVASTNRGCKALSINGVTTKLVSDGMSRGPVIRLPSLSESCAVMMWIKQEDNYYKLKNIFDSSSRFARLQKVKTRLAGRYLFLRFVATTGDAMGMNMISKGTESCLNFLNSQFKEMEILSISGNYCCDKKPAAINWIEGRGKSVLCEAVVPGETVKKILKTRVQDLIDVNISKNLIGSAMAGSIGGNNAHAANIVTAIYIATGQDVAQNVVSSNCMTLMEPYGPNGEDLYMTCTMPSVEIGTVGGGTQLPAQSACLALLGVQGASPNPGENAQKLAKIVCGCVLAGELSLMAALTSGHLVKSHLKLNRSSSCFQSF